MRRLVILSWLVLAVISPFDNAAALQVDRHPELTTFIDQLVEKHGFSREQLYRLFARVQLRPQVVEALQRPYEALPWYKYRKLFVTPTHVEAGAAFWREYANALERAETEFGVPIEIVVAILGVETRYGRNIGKYPVIDSLTTLALQYPRRSQFFRSELEQFLLLTREESLDPVAIKGSYAGAMGVPQFISSSYRRYAVDFDGDRRRDLIDEPVDAIGSVANYLHEHRWRRGEPIVSAVSVGPGVDAERYVASKLRTSTTMEGLRRAGIEAQLEGVGDARVGLVRLDTPDGHEYRAAFDNFYVITRYNQSVHYAMAIYELAKALREHQTAD